MHKLTWIVAMGTLACACSSDPKPPPETPRGSDNTEMAVDDTAKNDSEDSDERSEDSSPVSVDDAITKMCNLPTPRFNFDSANVSGDARDTLKAIADCFTDGPGKDKGLRIVGHADPRGETVYNFALGQKRAGSVAAFLSKEGVSKGRIATSSRGELEASGSDEDGWSRDRRVEIFLAE